MSRDIDSLFNFWMHAIRIGVMDFLSSGGLDFGVKKLKGDGEKAGLEDFYDYDYLFKIF